MAERRSARSSRRNTPSTLPPSTITSPQQGRVLRKRGTRSVSREIESAPPASHPPRRSARQASILSESEPEGQPTARRAKRNVRKEAPKSLPTVEEVELQDISIGTPQRLNHEPITNAQRSPGALSQMSGTTAISSFSSVEAELLNVSAILRQLPKLYSDSTEFLNHLVPSDCTIDDDNQHIQEARKPDSSFNETFRDLEEVFNLRLAKFRGEDQQYVRLRAVHRALLGPDRDPSTMWSGIDLIVYLANLVVFAKSMIGSDRNEPEIWGALRELDGSLFPQLFLPSLSEGAEPSPAGESSLLVPTFELALELRVQLAMQVLEEASERDNFNPEETLMELFTNSKSPDNRPIVRGWMIPGIGGKDEDLPTHLHSRVLAQMEDIRQHFPTDTHSLERGHLVDFESLDLAFPWRSLILQLLDWVRSRHAEIQTAIESLGGIKVISARLRTEMEQPNTEPSKKRKSRVSFRENRRRSSHKFDPHAKRIDAAVSLLKEKQADTMPPQAVAPRSVPPLIAGQSIRTVIPTQKQSGPARDEVSTVRVGSPKKPTHRPVQQVVKNITPDEFVDNQMYQSPEDDTEPPSSFPPSSKADFIREFREKKRTDKENHHRRPVDLQKNVRMIEHGKEPVGNEYDSASAQRDPSHTAKDKQQAEPLARKRRLPFLEEDSEDEDDAFETVERSTIAQERRQKAPVAKKSRTGPTSSAPTSHQPRPRSVSKEFAHAELEESPSDRDAPEMTEDQPPPSTIADFKKLARINSSAQAIQRKERGRGRVAWSDEEEQELVKYMGLFPQQYAVILKEDLHGPYARQLLQGRTQVNLKDKARHLAMVFIKSGTGVKKGFEHVIQKHTTIGKQLLDDGYDW
ncbi:hypothetical protein B0J11DRAFT_423907 [Dendryphion nanum]|uniref:Myb-like domain-containing protein n=1 Tax=Dendryphion nanum TaxID=256645 RepID=A0A9P9EKX8_9PLEO|nr:hypothetical protein B0J11DRAFT_423907 [Dendryphion nanum]